MENLVQISNGKTVTNSLLVSEKFNKQTQHVNRAIKDIIGSVQNWTDMFSEAYYKDSQGKEQPYFLMNRDGFSLLVMGFTGKKAMQFKLEFINAFNAMEKQLQNSIQVPTTFSQALRLAAEQAEQIEAQKKHTAVIAAQLSTITEKLISVAPKVAYAEAVLQSSTTYTTTQVAKEIGMSAIGLNKLLYSLGIQYKQSGQWMLYSKFQDKGLTATRTFPIYNEKSELIGTRVETVWTEKGRRAIHAKFNSLLNNNQLQNQESCTN